MKVEIESHYIEYYDVYCDHCGIVAEELDYPFQAEEILDEHYDEAHMIVEEGEDDDRPIPVISGQIDILGNVAP